MLANAVNRTFLLVCLELESKGHYGDIWDCLLQLTAPVVLAVSSRPLSCCIAIKKDVKLQILSLRVIQHGTTHYCADVGFSSNYELCAILEDKYNVPHVYSTQFTDFKAFFSPQAQIMLYRKHQYMAFSVWTLILKKKNTNQAVSMDTSQLPIAQICVSKQVI